MLRIIFAALVSAAVLAAPVSAAAQSTPAEKSKSAKATKKKMSAGQTAARDRQKKCGAEWKQAKAAGKIEKGTTWPKYWSACNKRLKAGA